MSDHSPCTVPDANDGMGGFCPRRTVLDGLLVNAAAEAGVEVREGFTVDALLVTDGAVAGVRGHERGGQSIEERARVVSGADGVNSFVARAVQAPEYDVRPAAACGYYSYFSGVTQDDIELYVRDGYAFSGAPTNYGLHLVMVNWPASTFPRVRADVEGHVWRALEAAPEMQALFGALRGNQDAINAFLSAITGAIPLPDFMSNANIGRIIAAAKPVEFHA
jgi:hypothetical protein